MSYVKDPPSFARLIQCGQESISTAAEDLATFVDITPYEYILVVATCSVIGSSTGLTVKFVSATASTGASAVTAKDPAGADLIATMPATVPTLADGNTIMLSVRTRGLSKWGSPQFTAAGAAMGVAYSIIGIGPRDTAELAAGWVSTTTATNTAGYAGVTVAEAGSFAP